MKKFALVMLLVIVAGSLFATGEAEKVKTYPSEPVQCIIPYSPGGGSDILTRAIMKYIEMDQPLVAVNIEGAGGMIGAMEAYHSKPTGYRILAHNPMDVVSYTLSGQTDVALWSELETICFVVDDFNVVSTNKQSGWKTLEEMVAYAKANPGKIKWGVTGSQTVNMADTVRVVEALGLTGIVTLVPYDGGAASKTALMGNHIQVETNSSSDIRSSVKSGDTIPLMSISSDRPKALPNVPTTIEKGIKVSTSKPRGYYAPKGTSPEAIAYLANAIKKVVDNPEFVKTVEGLGLQANFVEGKAGYDKVSAWVTELTPFFKQLSQGNK
ncbi:MAG: tripartite tricarboxylate transporter substrate binding protein [Spirochaetia bacterium]|nr:tripartite tricarboxylate transporter substrate binding protein [Spirochaetia bacterium]